MKNTLLIIATTGMLILTFVLGGYFNAVSQKERIKIKQIYVYPMDKSFILPQEVAKLIPVKDSVYKNIDIVKLERQLEQNDYISDAEVYKDLNGHLVAEVVQYHPIARVIEKTSYYIDNQGNKKPLSDHYTENVILVFGSLNTNNQAAVIDLIRQIDDDKNLKAIVSEIHVNGQKVWLKTDKLSADIKIDIHQDIEQQLEKLKAIYTYLVKTHHQNKYQNIDLRFENQAVCK